MQYAPLNGELNSPETELILMMRPACLFALGFNNCRKRFVILLTDLTLTSSCISNSSSVKSSKGPGTAIPALLTSAATQSQFSKTILDALTT